jgi:trehalose-6-phosphatase
VLSARSVETLQRRLRLHRLGYLGVHGAEIEGVGLQLVTEPDLELSEVIRLIHWLADSRRRST